MIMRTLNEMRQLVNEGKTEILTVEIAKKLKGKRISTIYFGYSGQDGIDSFVVGDVVSEFEYYRNKKEECYPNKQGHRNRAEYWESYMTEEQLAEVKDKLILTDKEGRNTNIFTNSWYDGGEFCCSDMDRFVSFVID